MNNVKLSLIVLKVFLFSMNLICIKASGTTKYSNMSLFGYITTYSW